MSDLTVAVNLDISGPGVSCGTKEIKGSNIIMDHYEQRCDVR